MDTTVFSQQLQKFRRERRMTQEQLAVAVGVSPQAVSKWENGRYPDGELLPLIARELDVSIDRLYGIGKPECSTEQRIVDDISELCAKAEGMHYGDVYDRILDYAWAMIIPCWKDNHWYYKRSNGKTLKMQTVSLIYSDEGFITMRHNDDLQYFFAVKRPEFGYEKYLGVDKETTELFAFLAGEANMKVILYMESLAKNELVTEKSLCGALGISPAAVSGAVEYLLKKGFIYKMKFDESGKNTDVYGYLHNVGIIMTLAGAKSLLKRPEAYQLQVGELNEPLFDRDKLRLIGKDSK